MSGMRTYDSSTRRKLNKPLHQLEKNMFEQNLFSYMGIITEKIDSRWCKVKLVPTISFSEFNKDTGYSSTSTDNPIVRVLIPMGMTVEKDHVVLIIFTDVNFRNTLNDMIKGKQKHLKFIEDDQTKHSINFGIIVNRLL